MQPASYLAFDLGASTGRAVLGRFDGRRMEMEDVYRFKTPMVIEGERLYWDLEFVWGALQEGLSRALTEEPQLRSLSVDSWGVDYVPLDQHMMPLRRAHVYRDPRVRDMEAVACERIASEALYGATGIMPLSINTLYQVLADEQLTPGLYKRTFSRLLIADYFNWRFCGRPVTEVSLGSTTQLLDPVTMDWSRHAMKALGIDPVTWPGIVPSGTVLGPVHSADNVVAVIAGCSHDTACAVAAVPADPSTNWVFLSSGTWSLLGVERRTPMCTEAARNAGFTNEVGFDCTIRLLKNMTGLWVLQECEREWRTAGMQFTYDTLLSEAEAADPIDYPIDFNDTRFTIPGSMCDRIADWCIENGAPVPGSRGDYVRRILESLAEMYRSTLISLEQLLDTSFDVLHVVGGGSHNTLLNQWTANRCQRRVIAGPAEATALGNLLVQAHAMGDIPPEQTLRSIAARSSEQEVYWPNSSGGS